MKKSRERILAIVLALILLYFVLLVLLVNIEGEASGFGGASDAIWYLLATLTTVGYGDISPVTPWGRAIGAILMLMSAGVMAWLIGLVVSLFYGKLYPDWWIWKNRKKSWFIFNKYDSLTSKIACSISLKNPDCAFIFLGKADALSNGEGDTLKSQLVVDSSIESIIKRKTGSGECCVFIFSENSWDNITLGKSVLSLVGNSFPVKVFCESESILADIPEGIKLINHHELISRSYWQNNAVRKEEKNFVFIGDGHLSQDLLERALIINVLSKEHRLNYYLFGNWDEFKKNHHELSKVVNMDDSSKHNDSVIFSNDEWNSDARLLENADRIIICSDDADSNAALAAEIIKYFPTNGKIHVYAQTAPSETSCFGTDEEIMSRKLIMDYGIDQVAIRLNDMYREKTGQGCSWEDLSPWHKASNIASADHLRVKIGLLLPDADTKVITKDLCSRAFEKFKNLPEEKREECRWIEHERWCRFHILHNWKFDETRDNKLRRHPLLKPYEELTLEQKLLDDSSWEVIGDLADKLGEEEL